MRVILITADDDITHNANLAAYLKKHYNIAHLYSMDTKRVAYSKKVIELELGLSAEIVKNLGTKMIKKAKVNYEANKHLLSDIDISTRSAKYKQIYEVACAETDMQISARLSLFYRNTLLKKLKSVNKSYESIVLGYVDKDIAITCDHFTANSIVEAVFRINKYHAYTRTKVRDMDDINANISVINTNTNLLEFYNYSNFL